MEYAYFVSTKLIQGIVAAADQMELPVADLLAAIGLSRSMVANADERLPYSKLAALWREIARRTQNPSIGLQLAELTQLETFNVTGYAMSHSPTLGSALDRLVRYSRLLNEGMVFDLTVEAGIATLTYQVVNAALPLSAVSVGWSLANIMLWAKRSLGRDWPLLRVTLQQSAPVDLSAYHRIFQSPLAFDESMNTLVFQANWLNQPLLNADSGLCSLLDRYAESLLLKLPQSESFVTTLQHLMAKEFRGREPKLDEIAAQMGYAPRTLQRKLQQAGRSFQQVLDDIRRKLACQYLKETSLTISEIAFLLGFSENTAFNRAFRRWTAMTPGEYRKRADSSTI
ncbi:MAG: AraC family transcriptional regulator [Leptolyngbyaceae cyanobacterium MO_188.B28]|nr:AraC family transcriptional regulator [Leptolyngbyaceae cyanobacterium MO_188.B28]